MTAEDVLDPVQDSYNTFSELPNISYSIITYLMDHDEDIWRILKYTTPDAWNSSIRSNLTQAEKAALIWDGIKTQTDCRVFMDIGDSSWEVQGTILRIFPLEIIAGNHVVGNSCVGLQVFTHNEISAMSNYQTRNMYVLQRILQVLNGADIDNIGRLFFDTRALSRCRLMTIGQLPMTGYSLVMGINSIG